MIDYKNPAYLYWDHAINPIPVNSDKSPALPAGHKFLYEFIDSIPKYFENVKGIGIAAGKISGGIECLDFDCHQGQNVSEIYNKFTNDPYIMQFISEGYMSCFTTPSGGYHIVIKSDFYESKQTLARYKDNNVMIEVRGDGSYFITHPTPGYNLIKGVEIVKLSSLEKDEREYIINLAKSFDLGTKENYKKSVDKKWPDSFDDNSVFGHFNNHGQDDLEELLNDHGWVIPDKPEPHPSRNITYWRRPGKDKGISATWGFYHNMFYVWTDATEFQAEKGYTICDVFLKLKFKDNFQEFKKWLYEKYQVKLPPRPEPSLDKFPIDIFPDEIQEFILEMNHSLNYNIDFLSVAFIFTFATLNGNRTKLKVKNGWIAPTIFWSIAVGEPGTMKTHPLSTVIGALQQIDRANKKRYDEEMDIYQTMLEETKKSVNEKKEPKPVFRQILVNDYTLEALHEVHSFNPNGIGLYRDEIVGFLNDMNKYRKGSDEQFWLESFNNKSYIINRVSKKPLLIDNTHINIVGSIQPEVLMKVIGEFGNNGLIDRFLFTVAETEIKEMTLDEMSEDILTRWQTYVEEIYDMILAQPENYIYTLTDEAKQEFLRIDKKMVQFQLSEDEPDSIKNYASKMKTYLPRFALLSYLMHSWLGNETKGYVDKIHMERAEKIVNYFINSARYVLTENTYKKEIRSVTSSLNGKSNAEKIVILSKKGYKNKDIAKELSVSPAYVSKVMKDNN